MQVNIVFERRPCIVLGDIEKPERKAFFHRWADSATTIEPSPFMGGPPGGQVWRVVGIVEYEDGSVEQVPPAYIKFTATCAQ